jgi:hypothetical protein
VEYEDCFCVRLATLLAEVPGQVTAASKGWLTHTNYMVENDQLEGI